MPPPVGCRQPVRRPSDAGISWNPVDKPSGRFQYSLWIKGLRAARPIFGRNRDAGSFSEQRLPTEFHQGCDCRGRGGVVGDLSVPIDRAGAALDAGERRAAGHADGERAAAARGRDEAGDAGDDAALQAGADGHQDRVRPRGVRGVHGAGGRRAALQLLGADALGAGAEHHDD